MFQRGVKCTNCHNAHTNGLKLEGSLVCGQCHAKDTYESQKHTLHQLGTVGVNCISCHMPTKVYMGNDERHDHSFRVPRPDLTEKYGTPNTCNSCHQDKTAKWAADAMLKHYEHPPAYHWSEDLVPGSRADAGSASHLYRLAADSSVPDMVRAATMRYLSQIGGDGPGQKLVQYLRDTSALVRHTALRGLRAYPASYWLQAAAPLLSDKVRAVRLAAADLYIDIPAQQFPAEHYQAFTKAKAELDRFINYQTDFAQGNLQAGDYFRRQNDLPNAEKFYLRAIGKDSQLVNARVNLASTLNASGKNAEALQQLQTASRIEPSSDHIFYTLGLLYAEMADLKKAEEAFRECIRLNPRNVRACYNYGLLLSQNGQNPQAEKIFLQALQADPTNGDVLYALAIVYLQLGQQQKARETGKLLKQYHGNQPAYADLLARMGIQ
jgi:tetratricopeptide (TPR) repeat protein